MEKDYHAVGDMQFKAEINKGAELPCVDFPSFKWLNVRKIKFDSKVFNRVSFKRVMIKIPSS